MKIDRTLLSQCSAKHEGFFKKVSNVNGYCKNVGITNLPMELKK